MLDARSLGPFLSLPPRARQVTGVLKGYDDILNLVLDETQEAPREGSQGSETRPLGLTVCRGTCVMLVAPADGLEAIANPFVAPEE